MPRHTRKNRGTRQCNTWN